MTEFLHQTCPICGADITGFATCKDVYHELSYYTLQHSDPAFIHQYIVDAYTAQHAEDNTKPIATAFALAGLYLHNEKNYSGKLAQRAHMELAKHKKQWPTFQLPKDRGAITVAEVLQATPGPIRDQAIQNWAASVWKAFGDSHEQVAEWLKTDLGI